MEVIIALKLYNKFFYYSNYKIQKIILILFGCSKKLQKYIFSENYNEYIKEKLGKWRQANQVDFHYFIKDESNISKEK